MWLQSIQFLCVTLWNMSVAAGLTAMGGVALGVYALGGLALGYCALGGFACAVELAVGGAAFGRVAIGQVANGTHALLIHEATEAQMRAFIVRIARMLGNG